MKTIDGERAQYIAVRLNSGIQSDLYRFGKIGIIDITKNYHAEIDEMITHYYRFMQKDVDNLHRLKNYFNKYCPLPVNLLMLRDESNIKTLEYSSKVPGYEHEITEFQLTWNELIITFKSEDNHTQSISLNDAKELAAAILEKP